MSTLTFISATPPPGFPDAIAIPVLKRAVLRLDPVRSNEALRRACITTTFANACEGYRKRFGRLAPNDPRRMNK